MKRILTLIVVLSLVALSGCACPRADSSGVITKNTTNCMMAAQDIMCNPSPDVLVAANVVLTLLKGVANSYLPGTSEFTAYVTAQNIAGVGCTTVTGLNGLIAYLQSNQAKSLMVAKSGPLSVAAVPVQPFIDWRNSAGK